MLPDKDNRRAVRTKTILKNGVVGAIIGSLFGGLIGIFSTKHLSPGPSPKPDVDKKK